MEKFDFFKLIDVSDFDDKLYIKAVISFFLSFIVSLFALPRILEVSYSKNLVDIPKDRSAHTKGTPNLGGVAIFFGIMVSATTFSAEIFSTYIFLTASLLLFLFVGVLDDILILSAKHKLYAQITVAILITIGSNIRVSSFFGILGIYTLPYWLSIIFSIFLVVLLINAFNLIDGIDGLAGLVTIIIFTAFGIAFYKIHPNYYVYSVLAASVIGATIPFLFFNLSKNKKIFMGDTGSMVLGFLMSFLSVVFLNFFSNVDIPYTLHTAPVMAIAILIIPVLDTLSVILIRILNGKNPISADQNHIHHRYLKCGFSHIQTSFYLATCNVLTILLAFILRNHEINLLLFIVITFATTILFLPLLIFNKK